MDRHRNHQQRIYYQWFRLVASDNHVVIAASYWGKFKTTFQMIMVILMIANIQALNIHDADRDVDCTCLNDYFID